MPRITRQSMPVLAAQASTATGQTFDVSRFRHIVVQVSAALNSSLTIKFQGSMSNSAPDFSAAQSGTNHWDYIAAYDYQTPSSVIAGDTGVVLNNDTVANNTRQYLINTDHLNWFSTTVTSYTDGNVTITAFAAND